MKAHILFLTFLLLYNTSFSQNLSGLQLLDKAIEYHDPNGNWDSFNGELFVAMETPNNPNRDSKIIINLPEQYFYVKSNRDSITIEYELIKNECFIKFNDRIDVTDEEIKTHRLTCERATMYKNYYTYLYGLPMKLKDNGTIIHDKVERRTFKGKEYLILKVTYDKAVGSDIWYFYFNPKTYAMEVYQFYRMDENGNQKEDTGEYILLSEEKTINNIIMPKKRAWYYNKDDKYLGTDILKKE
ncbi:MAG: hypothetical protein DRI75_00840 [Bacteroidetes bacterium]|nr:MAG: hypothetical protein DRI75_00840 [Bacteroidota bacterium]